jgi:hypothetical protein
MSFINRYTKEPHTYYDSKKIGDSIYGVGHVLRTKSVKGVQELQLEDSPLYEAEPDTKDLSKVNLVPSETNIGLPRSQEKSGGEKASQQILEGLITKVDLNGNIIWEKQYVSDDGKGTRFRKVIPCTNSDVLLLGCTADFKEYHLTRVDSEGNVLWKKYYPTKFAPNISHRAYVEGLRNGNFYLVVSDTHTEGDTAGGTITHIDNHLFLLNSSGDVIKQRSVAGKDYVLLLRGTTSNGEELVIHGSQYNRDEGRLGVALVFNDGLELVRESTFRSEVEGNGYVSIYNARYFQGKLMFGGRVRDGETSTGFLLRDNNGASSVTSSLVPGGYGIFEVNNTHVYNYYTTRINSVDTNIVSKLTGSFGVDWTKEFQDEASLYLNQADESHLIFHGYFDDEYLGVSNLELDTCKTVAVEKINPGRKELYYSRGNYIFSAIEYRGVEEKVTVVNLQSVIVEICPSSGGGSVPIKEITSLQSPNFFLQSTGSLGVESTKGIHLRWIFAGALGEKHLPKRDYAQTTHNFNKPNDVVNVYRAPYQKFQFGLNLNENPSQVNDTNRFWVYQVGERQVHVYFRNVSKYNQVRATINPATNASGFIQSYGDEVIEIENKDDLYFAVEMQVTGSSPGSTLQTETLSVQGNQDLAVKTVTTRKTFSSSELNNVRLVCENGRSLRLKTSSCDIAQIQFEYYADFIADTNKSQGWTFMGDYALTTQDSVAEALLEPTPGAVDGHWQRFNDNAYVKVENYQKKWNRVTEPWDRDIKEIVENYISLSNALDNPTGIDTVTFGEDPDEGIEPTTVEISTLDQLNFAAYDYHIARMLGLGFLDLETTVFTGQYVYVAEYTTFSDLEDGLGAREVHHLSMGLPTGLSNERLPIPVTLDAVEPGAFTGNEGEPVDLTDEDGYTHGGTSRFVTLYAESQPSEQIGTSFYQFTDEFALADTTFPVYGGLEYQHNNSLITNPSTHVWRKPELPNDLDYQNAVPTGETEHNETRFLQVPENDLPYYVHRQDRSGFHHYSSYGINWFSRASSSQTVVHIETTLQPANTLLPPSNVNPLLIRSESPLFLTSNYDQERLNLIDPNPDDDISVDETLVRITFDYNAAQDMIKRTVPLESQYSNQDIIDDTNNPDILFPNEDEIFADVIDVYFRGQLPNNVTGKALQLDAVPQPASNILTAIQTTDYEIPSSGGDIISPVVAPGTEDNYIGGVFVMGNQQHIIYSVVQGVPGPVFTVYKKEISDAIVNNIPAEDADNLQEIEISEDGLFMAIENMQNPSSWGTPNPHPLTIDVGYNSSTDIKREIIQRVDEDGFVEREVEKSRGIWSDSSAGHTTVTEVLEPIEQYDTDGVLIVDGDGNPVTVDVHRGMYKITFHGIQIDQHPQFQDVSGVVDSVEWYRGTARIFTEGSFDGGIPNRTRKVLPVVRIDNIPTDDNPNPGDLEIYVHDPMFPEVNEDNDTTNDVPYDYIQTGTNVSVNFYPGYKLYLYNNDPYGLNEETILPDVGEGVRYSIFGMRSRRLMTPQDYASKVSVPSMMFAQEIIEPLPPRQPQGADYATRPDFFGRSTFTLTTEYQHQPHGVLFYRSNDEALLSALYKKETLATIRTELKKLGGVDEVWLKDRWENFLDFDLLEGSDYETFPPLDDNPDFTYKFPEPDKQALFDWANSIRESLGQPLITDAPGTLAAGDPKIFPFVKGAIYSAFAPLTEVPIIYQYIESNSYTPVNEKQVVRDENGYALPPSDGRFKMAPMMKRVDNSPHTTQFVDFNLDGTSKNVYFYGVRELGSQLQMGEYSPFLGPIKLVNTNAPETPEIKRIMPVLETPALGIEPSIQLEINPYAEVENIKKITVYRAFNKLDAQSVRTMQWVKTIDLDDEEQIGNQFWTVNDNFEHLDEVPFGEGLFYRVTVSRKVEYATKDGDVVTEYQPSKPSKITATMMVEAKRPKSPVLRYVADAFADDATELNNIVLNWEKTCYNGTYSIYKMNSQGNWVKIHEVQSNEISIAVPLVDTDLGSGTLPVQNADGVGIYHHFKALVENTSGMISKEEYILTILRDLPDGGGIGQMIMGDTFLVR